MAFDKINSHISRKIIFQFIFVLILRIFPDTIMTNLDMINIMPKEVW